MEGEAHEVKRAHAMAFLKENSVGVLATADSGSQPHASAVYYACDDKFNIYFLTLLKSRKYAAIAANPKVAFAVGDANVPQTLQLEGMCKEVRHEGEKAALMPALIERLFSNATHYPPITRLSRSEIVVMWIAPTWVRFADYSVPSRSGDEEVFTEIPVE